MREMIESITIDFAKLFPAFLITYGWLQKRDLPLLNVNLVPLDRQKNSYDIHCLIFDWKSRLHKLWDELSAHCLSLHTTNQ